MENKDFDQHFYQNIHNILLECFDYANGEKIVLNNIYVYISFEWGVFFDVFFESMDSVMYERHKIHLFIKGANTSDDRQRLLNYAIHDEMKQAKEVFIKCDREIPTQIKIKYSPQTGKNKIKFNYEKLHNDKLFIGDDELAAEWLKQLIQGNRDL